jgi:hypothetical protein
MVRALLKKHPQQSPSASQVGIILVAAKRAFHDAALLNLAVMMHG